MCLIGEICSVHLPWLYYLNMELWYWFYWTRKAASVIYLLTFTSVIYIHNFLHSCWSCRFGFLCDSHLKMLCKFYKVVAGRASKSSQWPNMPLEGPFLGNIPTSVRYERFKEIFKGYERMLVPYAYFEKSLRQIEKNLNKTTSRGNMCNEFNVVIWNSLSESEKLEHKAQDCEGCCMYKCTLSLLFALMLKC